jgi:opacity protein-like surface antigen
MDSGLFDMIRFRTLKFNRKETYMQNKLSTITLAVIASTLLLGSASASATNYKGDYKGEAMPAPAPCPQPLLLRDGFYLGAQVGYDAYRVRASSTVNFPAGVGGATAGANYSANPVIASNGFAGGIFGGYGMYWNNWYYLGAEVFFDGSAASQAQNVSTTVNGVAASVTRSVYEKVSTGASWGISVLPGLKVNDSTLTYVRLGYNQAKLKGQSTYTVSSTAAGTTGATASASKNTWQGGFNYGLGIETAVYPLVSVRSEYSHTGYNSFSDSNGTKYSASDNQLMVSLIYHFA